MVKNCCLSLLGLLLMAGLAPGQSPVRLKSVDEVLSAQPTPPPPVIQGNEVLPVPSAVVQPAPAPTLMPTPWSGPAAHPVGPAADCWHGGHAARTGVWATNFEYLLWFIEHAETPLPLLTTDPALAPVLLPAAGIGVDHQSRLELQDRPLSGGRFTAEYWFLAEYDPVLANSPLFRVSGIEVSGFVLAERSVEFRNDFSPTLIRSFFDANNRRESGFVVAAPGVATGSVFGSGDVDLWGAEANYWQTLYANPPGQTCRVDAMGGFRYLNFNSGLTIQSQTVYNPVQVVPEFVPFAGNRIDLTDSFQTSNDFFGGQVGLGLNYITPCMIITANLKLGLGFTAQEIQIAGRQVRTAADGTISVADAGLLALDSNSGTFDRTRVSLVPEINFQFTFPVNRHCSLFAGYTLLGWSNVVRPGSQIDPVVDITRVPNFPVGAAPTGLARPSVPFDDEFLFIHGLNAGVKVVW